MRAAELPQVESISPVGSTEIRPTDTVPALFSSAILSRSPPGYLPRINGQTGLTLRFWCRETDSAVEEVNPFDLQSFPTLPDLESDVEDEDAYAAARRNAHEAITPSEKGNTCDSTVMRCPKCTSILKFLFVDETTNGVHHIHRCQSSCTCGSDAKKAIEHYGPVHVSRGAW